ncbi:hypothetical protein K443DRAFT_7758 [Laccaria amethystina LaAM-08-1]|uniref:Uncharacterized protein n=1 Tax=Laccaria amethystina LaAM-08-1 TaxID=1095629 RepID=A0A0C9XRK1_9AGAR|nr:hypothetical protein K443DRAFT_7758 [Laccaria amethystina LaAM-08-1]
MSTSTFTQSPRTSFESVYFDDDIHVAASTCKGVENQVADIMAFLIKELNCAVFPDSEGRCSLVQEPLPFFISMIVNATTSYILDIGAVIAAAHTLVMRLYETDPSLGTAWSGHQLFLSAFAVAAQEQPSSHPEVLNACVFWSILSKFTLEEVIEIQVCLFDKLEGRVCVFSEVIENVKQQPRKRLPEEWRQEGEDMKLAKKKRSLGGQMAAFLGRRRSSW